MLELDGWNVTIQDEWNWVFDKDNAKLPILVPKLGGVVTLEVLMDVMERADWSYPRYFELRDASAQ